MGGGVTWCESDGPPRVRDGILVAVLEGEHARQAHLGRGRSWIRRHRASVRFLGGSPVSYVDCFGRDGEGRRLLRGGDLVGGQRQGRSREQEVSAGAENECAQQCRAQDSRRAALPTHGRPLARSWPGLPPDPARVGLKAAPGKPESQSPDTYRSRAAKNTT